MNLKINLKFIWLLTLVLFLGGCQSAYQSAPAPEIYLTEVKEMVYEPDVIGIQSMIETYDTYTSSIHYPVFGYQNIDVVLYDFIQNRYELFRQELAEVLEANESKWPLEMHMEYEIVYQTPRHAAILFKERKHLGSAQPSVNTFTFNFNFDADKQLTLADLFENNAGYLQIISEISFDLLSGGELIPSAVDLNWVKGGLSPHEKNYSNFLMKAKTLVILFNKYQLGPAFIGAPSIEIPYESLNAYLPLKESLLNNFNGRIPKLTSGPLFSMDLEAINLDPEEPETAPDSFYKKRIAITFDDGPHPIYTPIIVDILKNYDAKATFFFLGNRIADYPDVARHVFSEGHMIGNHSFTHPQLSRMSTEEIKNEVVKTQNIIENATGFSPFLMRPPFGAINDVVMTTAEMPMILWSIDSEDWIYSDPDYIVNYVLDHAFDGAIIRLHDTLPNTTQAIGPMVDGLISAGYELVTVNELLGITKDSATNNLRLFSRALK